MNIQCPNIIHVTQKGLLYWQLHKQQKALTKLPVRNHYAGTFPKILCIHHSLMSIFRNSTIFFYENKMSNTMVST